MSRSHPRSSELTTNSDGLLLRRLTEKDADVYRSLLKRNREHLTRYGDYGELFPATQRSVADGLGET